MTYDWRRDAIDCYHFRMTYGFGTPVKDGAVVVAVNAQRTAA